MAAARSITAVAMFVRLFLFHHDIGDQQIPRPIFNQTSRSKGA
jgi:hypothetical protein